MGCDDDFNRNSWDQIGCHDCGKSFTSMLGENCCMSCCRKTPNPFRKIKIHMGCGKRDFGRGWFNIDGADFPHIHWHDATSIPFNNNSVDLIYCCHMLPFFDRQEVVPVLLEWKRVLNPGGILRLAVSDFETIAKLYSNGKYSLSNFLGPMFGKWEMNGKYVYEKTIYDYVSLKELLNSIGMRNIRRYNQFETEHSQFDDHSFAFLPHMDFTNGICISLNVECDK